MINPNDINRFEKHFTKTNGCWIWNKYKNNSNYGNFYFKKKPIRAHRFSYMLYKGKIPEGMLVCHSCDNPACVNPDHLWLGTHKDNMHDRDKKERFVNSMLGKKVSDETKLKLRKAHLGKKLSDEHKTKIADAGKGRKHSEETRKKMSLALIGNKRGSGCLGRKFSEDTLKKMSIASKGNKYCVGRVMSKETREKISATKKDNNKIKKQFGICEVSN